MENTTEQTSDLSNLTSPLPNIAQHDQPDSWKYYLTGLILVVGVMVSLVSTTLFYLAMHGVSLSPTEFFSPTNLRALGTITFLSGKDDTWSVVVEVFFFSWAGYSVRYQFVTAAEILARKFEFWQELVDFFGGLMHALGMAMVIVLLFRATKLTFLDVSFTLAGASFETVLAVSFILGFYSTYAARILEMLRYRFFKALTPSAEADQSDPSV